MPFPGIGNDVRINMPVRVTSGLDTPILREGPGDPRNPSQSGGGMLDLPPCVFAAAAVPSVKLTSYSILISSAYWDTNDRDWDDGEKD